MDILVRRDRFTDKSTISTVLIADEPICYVLEDATREVLGQPVESWKIKGETAIPMGRYRVTITFSNRFQRPLPLLNNVPGYEGVRIHPGNTPADTEGCLLPGTTAGIDRVAESKKAFDLLFARITSAMQDGDEVWCDVRGVRPP